MTVLKNKNGMIVALVLLLFIALVIGFYQYRATHIEAHTESTPQLPAYQTGKAFEVIESDKPASSTSKQSPEALIGEADQIIARANEIVAKHNLGAATLSAEDKQAVDDRIANIERKITELEQQLGQK